LKNYAPQRDAFGQGQLYCKKYKRILWYNGVTENYPPLQKYRDTEFSTVFRQPCFKFGVAHDTFECQHIERQSQSFFVLPRDETHILLQIEP
jgi:hypothetical protein